MQRKTARRQNTSSTAKAGQRKGSARTSQALYGDVLGIAGSILRSRQVAGAEKISGLADAARTFADNLSDIPNIKTYVTGAAEQIENLSDYVTESSIEEMVADATQVAKRYPVATAMFAVAVGFGVTRLVTHSARSDQSVSQKPKQRSSARGPVKATAAKKRGSANPKTRANGKDTPHERANAS